MYYFSPAIDNNMSISRVAFGTSKLHRMRTDRDRFKILKSAVDLGITHFDTSPFYGNGLSELALGKFLGLHQSNFTIATKFGIREYARYSKIPFLNFGIAALRRLSHFLQPSKALVRDFSLHSLEQSLEHSLKRMNISSVDFFYLHEPFIFNISQIELILDSLASLKRLGLIKHIGLSGNPFECNFIQSYTGSFFDVLQIENSIPYNQAFSLAERPLFCFGYFNNLFNSGKAPFDLSPDGELSTLFSSLPIDASHVFSSTSSTHLTQIVNLVSPSNVF